VARDKWPPGLAQDIAPLWHEPHGDRQTELVVRVRDAADRAWAEGLLRSALLTEAEMALPPAAWRATLGDPYALAWERTLLATQQPDELGDLEALSLKAEQRKLVFTSQGDGSTQLRERRVRAMQLGECAPCE
jgi:hypothetical protein